MIIKCNKCNTQFNLNEKPLLGRKVAFPCPNCKNFIHIDLSDSSISNSTQVENIDKDNLAKQSDTKSFEERLEKLFNSIQDLPTLPIVVQRILSLINDPESTAKQIGAIINSDQSLTAKTLKLVNSAYYGFEKKIKTVDQAIVIIGFDAVKNLALSASVFDAFKSIKQKSNFPREAFWSHSIGVAVASKIISEDAGVGIPGELFVAGLLHDIGKVILDSYFPEEMNKILYYASSNNLSFIEAEEKLIKIDHSIIGFRLGKRWNLPEELIYPIRFHHATNLSQKLEENICVVNLANSIVKLAKIGFDGDNMPPKISMHSFNIIKRFKKDFNKTDIEKYIEQVKTNMEDNEILKVAIE
ncbi:MAG: HDOD domain-containing protein [Spirochaetes bacterium]|nr:HDOD domain-containing protein [Spirochaetota bacterium]